MLCLENDITNAQILKETWISTTPSAKKEFKILETLQNEIGRTLEWDHKPHMWSGLPS